MVFSRQLKFIWLVIISCLVLSSCSKSQLEYYSDNDFTISSTDRFEYTHTDDVPVTYNDTLGFNSIQYSDGYLYFNTARSAGIGRHSDGLSLTKYDIDTGNLTFACSDPLCSHNSSDCKYNDMHEIMYIKDKLAVFPQWNKEIREDGEIYVVGDYRAVDIKNDKVYIRDKIDQKGYSELMSQIIVGDYVFYYDTLFDEALRQSLQTICRWNIKTGEIKSLTANQKIKNHEETRHNLLPCTLLFALESSESDARIFFTDTKTIFSTDINFENRIDHVQGVFYHDVVTDGEYIYYGVEPSNEPPYTIQRIHRVNFDGSDDIDLGIECEDYEFIVTEEYLYYRSTDIVKIGKSALSGYISDEVELYGSEIWRCRHDGSEKEMVFKFEGELVNYSLMDYCIVGNYIYGTYNYYIDNNGDGTFEDGDRYTSTDMGDYNTSSDDRFDIMRIDVTTGEIYIIDGII